MAAPSHLLDAANHHDAAGCVSPASKTYAAVVSRDDKTVSSTQSHSSEQNLCLHVVVQVVVHNNNINNNNNNNNTYNYNNDDYQAFRLMMS